jgi:hypothetical protein
MDIKGFDISDFIRHALTGFNFFLFVILLPLLYIQPALLSIWVSEASFFLIFFLSTAIGYLFDILKIYKLAPKYKKTSDSFWDDIANLLEVPKKETMPYFYLASNLSKKHGPYDLIQPRSRRVLMQNTSVILLISIPVWVYVVFQDANQAGFSWRLIIPFFIIFFSIIGINSLIKNAYRSLQEGNQEMLLFLKHNKNNILKNGWKIDMRPNDKYKS